MKKRLTMLCVMEIAYIVAAVLFVVIGLMVSCSTNHYFSVTAEDMSNPNIEYRDSINVTKPW